MLINSFKKRIELWKPARLVMMGAEQPKSEAPSVEQEMKAETIGEQQVALLLESNDVAGKENPVIKKYLDGVRVKLDKVWAKKYGKSAPPDIKDIEPGVDTSKEDTGRVPAAKAYRKVYTELMTLAIDTLPQHQEAQFNAHKEAVCQVHAKDMIAQFNEKNPEAQLDDKQTARIAAFINAAMGLNFDGNNKQCLVPAQRAMLIGKALKNVNIDVYAKLTPEQRTNVYYTPGKIETPNKIRATEFAKMDPNYEAVLNGLVFSAAQIEMKNAEGANRDNQYSYTHYLLSVMKEKNIQAGMPPNEFRNLFLTYDQFLKKSDLVASHGEAFKKDVTSVDRYEKMSLKDKMVVADYTVNRALRDATASIPIPDGDEEGPTMADLIAKQNEFLAKYWEEEGLGLSGLTAANVSAVMEKKGYVVHTEGANAPKILRRAVPAQTVTPTPAPEKAPATAPVKPLEVASTLTPPEKVKKATDFFNEAIARTNQFIGSRKLNVGDYTKILNNIITSMWKSQNMDAVGLDGQQLNQAGKVAGLTVLTHVTEGKPPEIEAKSAAELFAKRKNREA